VIEDMLKSREYTYLGATIYIDWVYVDNVAFAHLLAEKQLRGGAEGVAGQAFNVTDNDPVFNIDFRERVIYYSGNTIKRKYAPYNLIMGLAHALHLGQVLLKHNFPKLEPPFSYLTLVAMRLMNVDMVVRSSKAKRVLGYETPFSLDEGIQLAIAEYDANLQNRNILFVEKK
jgi:nucleoside-diphosphate-sugar epimerase